MARSRRADRRDFRDGLQLGKIRRDALDLRAGASEIADVGDVDLLVDTVELQTEQRGGEFALCKKLAVPVVLQQLDGALNVET